MTRYTSLTCLICQTLIYRVLHAITPDLDSDEGPIQPTEDWVEDDLLQTSSGWIEVFEDCIVRPFFSLHVPNRKDGSALDPLGLCSAIMLRLVMARPGALTAPSNVHCPVHTMLRDQMISMLCLTKFITDR